VKIDVYTLTSVANADIHAKNTKVMKFYAHDEIRCIEDRSLL